MADDTDLDPSASPGKTLDQLTLRDLTGMIHRPCTNGCGKSATAFFGYLQGATHLLDELNQTSYESEDDIDDSPTSDVPLFALDKFVRSCAPPEMASAIENYSGGQVVDWFFTTGDDDSLISLIDQTRNECFPEFCKALTWKGNPDVSGIGVSSTVHTCLVSSSRDTPNT